MITVAIVGAGGHIGRSLARALCARDDIRMSLYTRHPPYLQTIVDQWKTPAKLDIYPTTAIDGFWRSDVVINCVGLGDQTDIARAGVGLLIVQERIDQQILANLELNPETLYVSLSSGAAFGLRIGEPVTPATMSTLDPRDGSPGNGYSVAKLYSEIKHRTASHLNIVDLRLYGYVSAFHPMTGRYLLSGVMQAIRGGDELETTPQDFERDYSCPEEIVQLVDMSLAARPLNLAFDVYSRGPTRKFALLDAMRDQFGMRYRIDGCDIHVSERTSYYSTDHTAAAIGYRPKRTALENVLESIRAWFES